MHNLASQCEVSVDKSALIRSYLESQRIYATARAVQRPRDFSPVDHSLHAVDIPNEIPIDSAGEDVRKNAPTSREPRGVPTSPRLLPRSTPAPTTSLNAALSSKSISRPQIRPPTQDDETHNRLDKQSNHTPAVDRIPSSKRRRGNMENDDPDYLDRLDERRERKRARRAITQPEISKKTSCREQQPSDVDDDAHGHLIQLNKRKKRIKMTAGMALMHGFAAANVGSNRLTLHPLEKAGVFQKGKSSSKAISSVSRKKNCAPDLFNEIRFLSKVSSLPQESHISSLSSAVSMSAPVSPKKYKITNYTDRKRNPHIISTRPSLFKRPSLKKVSSSSSSPTKPLSEASATPRDQDSIVWDIEQGKDLPEGSISILQDPGVTRTSTVVLDTRESSWHREDGNDEDTLPIHATSTLSRDHGAEATDDQEEATSTLQSKRPCSPSTLAPWHSASQCGMALRTPIEPHVNRQTSRFFILEHAHNPPVLPSSSHPLSPENATAKQSDLVDARLPALDGPDIVSVSLQPAMSSPLTRLPSPSLTVDSLQEALRLYETEDRSALHVFPAAAVTWRSTVASDLSSDVSGVRLQPLLLSDPDTYAAINNVSEPAPAGSILSSATALFNALNVYDPSLPPYVVEMAEDEPAVQSGDEIDHNYIPDNDNFTVQPEETVPPHLELPDDRYQSFADDLPLEETRHYAHHHFSFDHVYDETVGMGEDQFEGYLHQNLAYDAEESMAEEVVDEPEAYHLASDYDRSNSPEQEGYAMGRSSPFSDKTLSDVVDDLPSSPPYTSSMPDVLFQQGKELLDTFALRNPAGQRGPTQVELDVAARLHDHWHPVRP